MTTKRPYILLLILLSVHFTAKAQSTPEAFLSQLPTVPAINCVADTNEVNRFTDRIYKVKVALKENIDRIHSQIQSDIGQIPNNVNEKQSRKAAEKAVSEQYGFSLQDLEKVGEMSDAEQEKWAQQYASGMMNEAKKNPEAAIKKGDKAKQLFALASEQKTLGERITERMSRVAEILKNVEIQDSIETRKLTEQIRPLEKQLCSGICSDAEIARSRAAEKQIQALKIKFCEKLSPLQADAISQYLTTLKSLLPDYRRLTEVQNETVKLQQIGEIIPQDLSCYTAIDEYADILLEAYKYCVGKTFSTSISK